MRYLEGALDGMLEILQWMEVVGHLAHQGLGGVGGVRGKGDLGAGSGLIVGGGPTQRPVVATTTNVRGVPGMDPAAPIAIVPLT